MNTDVLDKPIVLSLNRAWQVIGHRTVKQALIALNGGAAGLPPALGVDIAYPKTEDGSWNFDRPLYLNPIPWDEWVKLPVRDFDFSISTPKLHVRVPTVPHHWRRRQFQLPAFLQTRDLLLQLQRLQSRFSQLSAQFFQR